jgi:hypothetical protein
VWKSDDTSDDESDLKGKYIGQEGKDSLAAASTWLFNAERRFCGSSSDASNLNSGSD